MSVPGNLYTPTIRKTRGGDYLIEQSLLFNDDDSAHLTRTPSTAGNRKTWTFSAWVKRGELATGMLFSAGNSNTDDTAVYFVNNNIQTLWRTSSSNTASLISTAEFRDPSAWYHLVFAYDTTQSTASDRIKIWVNGTRLTNFSTETYPSQNLDSYVNDPTVTHYIGRNQPGNYFDGLIALPILVGGAALDPTSFGEEDDDGYWNPIEFTGADTLDYVNFSEGTVGGTMTSGGGNAAAFDGETIETAATAAGGATTGCYVSKAWSAAKTITGCAIWGVTTSGHYGSGTGTLKVEGSATGAWAGEEVTLGTKTGVNFAVSNSVNYFASGDLITTTAYDYHRVYIERDGGGVGSVYIAEVQFYEDSATAGHGTNGFELDYADTADFGKDVSSTRTALTANYVTSVSNDGGGGFATSPVTFSSVDIGTASATRKVIVGVGMDGYQGNEAYTSLTIGGVAANLVGVQNAASGGRPVALYELDVSSGTSADIVVTFTGTQTKCYSMGIGVWTIEGGTLFSTVGSTANPGAGNISVSSGGTVIAIMTEGSASATYTWANLTENFDNQVRASRQAFSGASKNLSSATTQAISATSSGGSQFAMLAASFAPANDYLSNNFTASDQLSDTPTDSADDEIGNFATLDPNNRKGTSATLSEGNTKYTTGAVYNATHLTQPLPTTGKWGWSFTWVSGSNSARFGIVNYLNAQEWVNEGGDFSQMKSGSSGAINEMTSGGSASGLYRRVNGTATAIDTSATAKTWSAGEVLEFLYDADNLTLDVKIDGASLTQVTGLPADQYIACCSSYNAVFTLDCGQKGYTPSDASYKALATQNLPAPTIADGSDYFNTVLYTGTGSSNAVTGVGFQPDFVWIKGRSVATNHKLFDVVRGSNNALNADETGAESADSNFVSIDSDGFTVTGDAAGSAINKTGDTFVAWCWKAGGAASSNTDGSITSSVSANPTAGFSIVSYTGTGAVATVGHGLGVAPDMIIVKNRDNGGLVWAVYHSGNTSAPETDFLTLNGTDATNDVLEMWNDTSPASTVFTVGTNATVNNSADDLIAYCWAEVEGFSKFGSYTGNGSANGPFIFTGFRCGLFIIKCTSTTGGWYMVDSRRNPYNPVVTRLYANSTVVDADDALGMDFTANGVKFRNNSSAFNTASATYIYAAFAENPFQGDDGYTQARAR